MHNDINSSRLRANIAKTILVGSLSVAMVPAWSGLSIAASDAIAANGILATDFALNSKAYAAEDEKTSTAASESQKDETVYIKTSANGQVSGVYVVNRFAAGSGTAADPANYQSVSNMTTSDALTQENGAVKVPLQSNQPLYYEGQMTADVALPWTIKLTYYLDGKAISPAELGGATGDLRIELNVVSRTLAPEPGIADFANSYVLQAQGTFDSASFEMKKDDNLMVAQVGSEAVVNCMVLPGESKTFVLEGAANNFASSGWQISALPLALAIDIAEQDTSQLTDATSQLTEATGKLANGSSALSRGMDEAVSGVAELMQGSGTFANGIAELSEGMNELASSNGALLEGWAKIDNGAATLAEGTDDLLEGSATFRQTIESAQENMQTATTLGSLATSLYEKALAAYVASPTAENKVGLDNALAMINGVNQAMGAEKALTQVLEGYGELEGGISAVNEGARALSSGAQEFDEYLNMYLDGVTDANEGVKALSEGAAKLIQGTDELSAGANDLQAGAQALASGSAQLADSVKGMDAKLLAGIQEAIDEKLGADFELHSFVAPENTSVNSVQFVYMVDGVSADDSSDGGVEATSAAAEEEPSIFERFIAWIKGLFA